MTGKRARGGHLPSCFNGPWTSWPSFWFWVPWESSKLCQTIKLLPSFPLRSGRPKARSPGGAWVGTARFLPQALSLRRSPRVPLKTLGSLGPSPGAPTGFARRPLTLVGSSYLLGASPESPDSSWVFLDSLGSTWALLPWVCSFHGSLWFSRWVLSAHGSCWVFLGPPRLLGS